MHTLSRLALCLLVACALSGTARATTVPPVKVRHAWIRVLPGSLPNAGYATLVNDGATNLELVKADSPAYGKVMLHQSSESGGISRMRDVDHLTIPAHGAVRLAPGGYHLMLMHPVHPVKIGTRVRIILHFASGAILDTRFLARPANASGYTD